MDTPASQNDVFDPPVESILCERCSVLPFDDRAEGYEIRWGGLRRTGPTDYQRLDYKFSDQLPDLNGLRTSRQAGCAFCGALRDAVLTTRLNTTGKVTFELSYAWNVRGLSSLWVDVKFEGDGEESSPEHDLIEFMVGRPEEGDRLDLLPLEVSSSHQRLSLQNIAWVKKHLDFCDTHHLAGLASAFKPTRLLDLHEERSNKDFRIIHTSDGNLGNDIRYAALSYCWGPDEDAKQQLKTLSCNVRQHHDLILFDNATPVVQDAVTTARALCIRYLWIDALCIIQDDARDWAHESDQMRSVYTNAYVTLCTLTSTSCMEGFLHRPSMVNVKFQSQRRPGVEGIFTLHHEEWKRVNYSAMGDNTSRHPWDNRAWTMQEKHLSKRRLYFDRSDIYLDCPRGRLTETMGYLLDDPDTISFADDVMRFKKDRNKETLHSQWNFLLLGYLSRLLTHQTDALPAISGLAQIMAAEIDDVYLAGLWKHKLPQGLLWYTIRPIEDWESFRRHLASHRQAVDYIAPTWSWVSRGVGKAYELKLFTTIPGATFGCIPGSPTVEIHWRSECHISAVWCTPVLAEHPYGRLKHGELHINGKLEESTSVWMKTRWRHRNFGAAGDGSGVTCAFDFAAFKELEQVDALNVFLLLLGTSCYDLNHEWPPKYLFENILVRTEKREEHVTDEIKGNLNQSRPRDHRRFDEDDENDPKYHSAWGLALTPVPGSNKFERIGIFRISWEFGGPRYFDHVPVSTVEII